MESLGCIGLERFDRLPPLPLTKKVMMNSDVPLRQDSGKRAVHVKWDGKTIALGTFPTAEAADKCERAKVLTKRWRSTMRPKPSVDWVKASLERLQLRVVNDRPGRRKRDAPGNVRPIQTSSTILSHTGDNPTIDLFPNHMGHGQMTQLTHTKTSSSPTPPHYRRLSNVGAPYKGTVSYDPPPPQPPLRGLGGAAPSDNDGSGNQTHMGEIVGSTEHYEVLKRHHFKLLREIQETTNLMNLYHREHMANDVQMQQQQGSMFGQNSYSQLDISAPSFGNSGRQASRRRSSLSMSALADNILGDTTRSLSVSSHLQGLNAALNSTSTDPFSLLVQQPQSGRQNDILGQHNLFDNGMPSSNGVDAITGSRRPSLSNRMRFEDDILALTRSRGGDGLQQELQRVRNDVTERETMLKAAILAEQRGIVERRLSNSMERSLSFPMERRLSNPIERQYSNQMERRLSNPIERGLSDAQEKGSLHPDIKREV